MLKRNKEIATGRKRNVLRWTLEVSASEFNINPRTLAKRIKVAGIEPGKDRKFSTAQICAAVFGDIDGERLRLIKEQADEKALANSQSRGELVNYEAALEILRRAHSAITSTILGMTHLTIEDRETIINQVRAAGEAGVGVTHTASSAAALHG